MPRRMHEMCHDLVRGLTGDGGGSCGIKQGVARADATIFTHQANNILSDYDSMISELNSFMNQPVMESS
jgi:hypothetical protein